jgi:hypothetical protein
MRQLSLTAIRIKAEASATSNAARRELNAEYEID